MITFIPSKADKMTQETLSPMQQELLSRADTIFQKVSEAASKAYDVASEQLPDIAYQFIAYNRVYLTSVITISLLIEIALIWFITHFAVKSYKQDLKNEPLFYDYSPLIGIPSLVLFVYTVFVLLPTMLITFKPFIMVWFAPKLFLITEIIHLVK